jgi:hypothetical protein
MACLSIDTIAPSVSAFEVNPCIIAIEDIHSIYKKIY